MSIEHSMEQVENMSFSRQCDEIDLLSDQSAMLTGSCEPNATIESANAATDAAVHAIAATNDGGASATEDGNHGNGNEKQERPGVGNNQGNSTVAASISNRIAEGRCRRKNRRRKSNRGKSSSNRPYSKTNWKFQYPAGQGGRQGGQGGAEPGAGMQGGKINHNKRRHLYSVAASRRITPFQKSDKPPLVPYNTNRFLMEDHMPQVLTPSGRTRDSSFSIDSEENYFYSLPEDEEDFLTKEFSSVYERERFDQLESLSHPDLVQEYIKLAVEYEQTVRRSGVNGSGGGGGGAGGGSSGGDCDGGNMAKMGNDAERGDDGSGSRNRLLEERVKVLERENMDLRRQLEYATRMGFLMPARSSPRYGVPATGAPDCMDIGEQQRVQMDSSTSEDSESDSSSTSSSSNSSSSSSSSSSMSDDNGDEPMGLDVMPEAERNYDARMVNGFADRSPLSPAMNGGSPRPNGAHESDPEQQAEGDDDEQELLLNGVDELSPSPRPSLAVE